MVERGYVVSSGGQRCFGAPASNVFELGETTNQLKQGGIQMSRRQSPTPVQEVQTSRPSILVGSAALAAAASLTAIDDAAAATPSAPTKKRKVTNRITPKLGVELY